ncbi:MAG: hypothetical protein IPL40_11415 [Proteobacteria bacterium]|nr:hypothetical protein [Pseudomonadota bacterium]
MSDRLHVEVTELENVNYVALAGVIDEDNALSAITERLTKPLVVIKSADVERINSCGVRDWVNWLGELQQKQLDVYLIECSPAMMTQVNLINNFTGHGKILSFYSPYFCPPPCESDKMLLIRMEEALRTQPFRAPVSRCDECDQLLEFDDLESSYFGFLAGLQLPKIPPEVEQALRKVSSGDAKPLRSRSSMIKPALATVGAFGPSSLTGGGSSSSIPSSRELKSLLSEVSFTHTPFDPEGASPAPFPNKLLYVVVGLLSLAILLLTYVVFRGG